MVHYIWAGGSVNEPEIPNREAVLSPFLSKMTLEIGHVPCGDPGSYAYELVQKILAPVECETFKPEKLPHLPDVDYTSLLPSCVIQGGKPSGMAVWQGHCPRGTVCAQP